MTPINIQKNVYRDMYLPLNWTTMNDKMGPNKLFVDAPNVAYEENAGNEHVVEVLEKMILQTKRGGIQYIVALRDDEGDTMQSVHEGMKMGEQNSDGVCRISRELDGVDPNVALRLTSILDIPHTVLIPRRNCDTLFIDYLQFIIITSDEYNIVLKQKQERHENVSRE